MINILLLTSLLLMGRQSPAPVPMPPTGHDLNIKDVIAILADYDIKHTDQQPFFRPAYGVTNFDSNPPAVWIFNTGDTASKRSTVIHELLHVYYKQIGIDTGSPEGEAFIAAEETRLYLQIFGDESKANH